MIVFTNAAGSLKHFEGKSRAQIQTCNSLGNALQKASVAELEIMLDNIMSVQKDCPVVKSLDGNGHLFYDVRYEQQVTRTIYNMLQANKADLATQEKKAKQAIIFTNQPQRLQVPLNLSESRLIASFNIDHYVSKSRLGDLHQALTLIDHRDHKESVAYLGFGNYYYDVTIRELIRHKLVKYITLTNLDRELERQECTKRSEGAAPTFAVKFGLNNADELKNTLDKAARTDYAAIARAFQCPRRAVKPRVRVPANTRTVEDHSEVQEDLQARGRLTRTSSRLERIPVKLTRVQTKPFGMQTLADARARQRKLDQYFDDLPKQGVAKLKHELDRVRNLIGNCVAENRPHKARIKLGDEMLHGEEIYQYEVALMDALQAVEGVREYAGELTFYTDGDARVNSAKTTQGKALDVIHYHAVADNGYNKPVKYFGYIFLAARITDVKLYGLRAKSNNASLHLSADMIRRVYPMLHVSKSNGVTCEELSPIYLASLVLEHGDAIIEKAENSANYRKGSTLIAIKAKIKAYDNNDARLQMKLIASMLEDSARDYKVYATSSIAVQKSYLNYL